MTRFHSEIMARIVDWGVIFVLSPLLLLAVIIQLFLTASKVIDE